MEWQHFDETADHYQFGVAADFSNWFGVTAEYLRTEQVTSSVLPPRYLSFYPYILTTGTESYRFGTVFSWKPFKRVTLFAKPMVAYNRTYNRWRGGTAIDDMDAWYGTFATETRFVPAAGISVYLGRGFSVGLEIEKSKMWRLDTTSATAYLSYKF